MIRSGMVRFHDALEPLLVPIGSVQPAPYNYNNGAVELIQDSILLSGMYGPIKVQKSTGDIVAGNHTWMACRALESESIPVVVLDIDDTEAKRILVGDNKIAAMAKPDQGLLAALLHEIKDDQGDLGGSGYTDEELTVLDALNDIPLDLDEFAQWPQFSVQVPPNVLRGFRHMTREADDDRQAFELILRLAGWQG